MKAATPLQWKVAFYYFSALLAILLVIWFVRAVLSVDSH